MKVITECPQCGERLGFDNEWSGVPGATVQGFCLNYDRRRYGAKTNGCMFICIATRMEDKSMEFSYDGDSFLMEDYLI